MILELTVACPICGAEERKPCINLMNGKEIHRESHETRRLALKKSLLAQGWAEGFAACESWAWDTTDQEKPTNPYEETT